jgi:hypothetical protein
MLAGPGAESNGIDGEIKLVERAGAEDGFGVVRRRG